jgi:hypothetical protein
MESSESEEEEDMVVCLSSWLGVLNDVFTYFCLWLLIITTRIKSQIALLKYFFHSSQPCTHSKSKEKKREAIYYKGTK